MNIGIIMDGNGRWATQRGLPRSAGHRAGADAVDRVVEAAVRAKVSSLTLYAFSAANWQRPTAEVDALFRLLRHYLLTQTPRCLEQSVRLNVIGRRDRLDTALRQTIERSEALTAHGAGLLLRLAIDYSSQHTLLMLARHRADHPPFDSRSVGKQLATIDHSARSVPAIDLLIRTGGERRLSDFLLWECAYAELIFSDCLWPDFDAAHFERALREFAGRERRFGAVSEAARVAAHG